MADLTLTSAGITTTLSFGSSVQKFKSPWSTDYGWQQSAPLPFNDSTVLVVALAKGGLNDALPAPVVILQWKGQVLSDIASMVAPSLGKFSVIRDLLAEDLNGDGKTDLFFSNHGPEPKNAKFPGEPNTLMLSKGISGSAYEVINFPWSDFSHGSSIGDFNGDGRKDIFINNFSGSNSLYGVPAYWLRQSTSGSFERIDVLPSVMSLLGDFTTSLDIDSDGRDDLITITKEGDLLAILNISSGKAPATSKSIRLDMPSQHIYGIESFDFDGNGSKDILVYGYGNEVFGDKGVLQGRELRAFIIFDPWRPTQKVVSIIPDSAKGIAMQGGIKLQTADLDKNGTIDIELRTYLANWSSVRYTVLLGKEGGVSAARDVGDFSFVGGTLFDVNGDGVLDAVYESYFPEPNGWLNVRLGILARNGSDGNDYIVGTSASEILSGNGGDDTLIGAAGNDTLSGGGGYDIARYVGRSQDYKLGYLRSTGQLTVSDTVLGRDGVDSIAGVETLSFSNKNVIVESRGGKSFQDLPASIYQFFILAFSAAPGLEYLSQCAAAYRDGASVKAITNVFTTKSQFTDTYPTTMSNRELATRLINNVVGSSASDKSKVQAVNDIVSAMDGGLSVGNMIFTVFSNLAAKPLIGDEWSGTARLFQNQIAVAKFYSEIMNQCTTDLTILRTAISAVTALSDVGSDEAIVSLIGQGLFGGL